MLRAMPATTSPTAAGLPLHVWAERFLHHLAAGKPSAHTLTAYRGDLDAVLALLATHLNTDVDAVGGEAVAVTPLRAAFAAYAGPRSPATVTRAWSAWNRFATFLLTEGVIAGNPMAAVPHPKSAKTLPKALPDNAVARLVTSLADSASSPAVRADEWPERDFAIIALILLTGLRSAETKDLNIGDAQPVPDDGLRIRLRGKGRKERVVHASPPLTALLENYLSSRVSRHGATRRAPLDAPVWQQFTAADPFFINTDNTRLTQGTLQYRVKRAYRNAGIEPDRAAGALTHALRHTFATVIANDPTITVHTLARMLGHESIATTQRYTEAAGGYTREASAANPIYRLIPPQAGSESRIDVSQ
jgi:integrase/recombinase XerC